jgi:hypothetical protein
MAAQACTIGAIQRANLSKKPVLLLLAAHRELALFASRVILRDSAGLSRSYSLPYFPKWNAVLVASRSFQ